MVTPLAIATETAQLCIAVCTIDNVNDIALAVGNYIHLGSLVGLIALSVGWNIR